MYMTMAITGSDDNAGPVKKNKEVHCHFKSAWKSQEFTVIFGGAEKTASGTILSGVEGANDVVKHNLSTKGHWQAVTTKSSSSTLASFGHSDRALKARRMDEQQMQVQQAEAMFI